jgi:hypothetical protein
VDSRSTFLACITFEAVVLVAGKTTYQEGAPHNLKTRNLRCRWATEVFGSELQIAELGGKDHFRPLLDFSGSMGQEEKIDQNMRRYKKYMVGGKDREVCT